MLQLAGGVLQRSLRVVAARNDYASHAARRVARIGGYEIARFATSRSIAKNAGKQWTCKTLDNHRW